MKKYKLLIFLISGILFTSCKYETLPTYSGTDNVYFAFADTRDMLFLIDSTTIYFGYDKVSKTDSTVTIPLRTLGDLYDFDRPVDFMLIDSMATEVILDPITMEKVNANDYIELIKEKSFIQANSIDGQICLKIKNPGALDSIHFKIGIILLENEYFETNFDETNWVAVDEKGKIKANRFYILFNNADEMPNLWAALANVQFRGTFGTYSRVKFDFICGRLDLDRDYFTYIEGVEIPDMVYAARFDNFMSPWLRFLNKELKDLKDSGNTLYDERGNEVKMGSSLS